MSIAEKILKRIAELEKAKSDFVLEAQRNLAGFEAAIGELKKILEEESDSELKNKE